MLFGFNLFFSLTLIFRLKCYLVRESRAEGRAKAELFEPYPPEAEKASYSASAQDNILAVKKINRERKKQIKSKQRAQDIQ